MSEPSSGSDAFALKTVAKKDGDHYYINGTKMWISNSDIAGIFYVFANTDPSQVKNINFLNLSIFLMCFNTYFSIKTFIITNIIFVILSLIIIL